MNTNNSHLFSTLKAMLWGETIKARNPTQGSCFQLPVLRYPKWTTTSLQNVLHRLYWKFQSCTSVCATFWPHNIMSLFPVVLHDDGNFRKTATATPNWCGRKPLETFLGTLLSWPDVGKQKMTCISLRSQSHSGFEAARVLWDSGNDVLTWTLLLKTVMMGKRLILSSARMLQLDT